MTDYPYDMDIVVDPNNPANVVTDGAVYLYDPADTAGTTPIALRDTSGLPLPNPMTPNAQGYLQPRIATIPQTMWKSGPYTGFFNSYVGLRNEAVAAKTAAETAQGAAVDAASTAAAAAEAAQSAADGTVTSGEVVGDDLVLTRTDSTTVNAGNVRGPQGLQGLQGAKGDTGNAGPQGDQGPAGPATTDASLLATGTVPDARLPTRLADAQLGATYAPTDGGNTTNRRAVALNTPTFDGSFSFSKISSNQDGLIAVKDLNVSAGFGGQVGQGGAISYFKAIGIAGHHSGPGNYDHFWGSLYHDGTREAGMFIGDITGRRGGNVYGGHFRVQSDTTAPPYLVGLALELIPNVAKGAQVTKVLGAGISANTPTTTITLTTAEQFTSGTNLSFVAADSSLVVAYVSATMGAPSTSIPVTSFTTASPIANGGNVTVGVNSTYLGLDIQNNGSQSASAAVSVSHHGSAASPFTFGINFDSSAASPTATAIMLGGSWGSGINMNANSMVSVGSITGVGASPNRDVRLVDNLLLDNARHIKFKDAGGTARKIISVTSSDNFRIIAPGASKQFEFYDSTEATLLARITSGGRADFSLAGVTTKYTSGPTQPAYLTSGQVEVWHDTGSGTDYLIVNSNGVSKKVALT